MQTLAKHSAKKSVFQFESPQSYAALRAAVRQAIVRGSERALAADKQEKVQTCWEVGKLILQHVLLNQYRADYSKATVKKLAKNLGLNAAQLAYMLEFARAYPICPASGKLTWSHYRELLGVSQIEARQRLAEAAIQNEWSSQFLRGEIKKLKA